MIRLDIEDYCNNCTMFEPEVVERPMSVESLDGTFYCGDTVIKCINCNTCKNLMKYLQTKFREEPCNCEEESARKTREVTNNDTDDERCCSNCKSYMFSNWEEPCNKCVDYSQFH